MRDADAARISAVIPTYRRADLVGAAIDSVLAQTRPVHELVVVVDGEVPDPAVLEALERVDDPRLRTFVAGRQLGNAEARNAGIALARGDWIALLDDDDTWMPDKLERQCEAVAARGAAGLAAGDWIASSRLLARAGARSFRWPRLVPREDEALRDYLFCRRWPLTGDRLVQTSTVLAPRELFRAVPFRDGRRFVDQDWLLRVGAERDAALVFPDSPEPLVAWDLGTGGRPRVSHYRNWRWCIDWARERRELLGPRAHAAFLLTLASASAADAGEPGAFVPLLREAFAAGRPNAAELATHCLNFALSRSLRDRAADRINRALGS